MNEQILALAKQAGFYVFADRIYIPTISEDITACQTKFAELIVKQCVSVVKEHYDNTLPWGGVENVLEHFGVEE